MASIVETERNRETEHRLLTTHTHTPMCGYGLRYGPTGGLSSWWPSDRSSPDNNNQLACLNHAINFLFYCVAGKRFRAELAAMFRCSQRGASTTAPSCQTRLSRQQTDLPLHPHRSTMQHMPSHDRDSVDTNDISHVCVEFPE